MNNKFQTPPLGKQHANKAINKAQNPVTKQQAEQEITKIVNESGMPPKMFAKMGKLAEAAINDKKKYKDFVDFMVKYKLETKESLKKPDMQMLASLVVIGKVAETMPDKEAVGAPPGMANKIQGL